MKKTYQKINLDDIFLWNDIFYLGDSNLDEETLSKMQQSLDPVYAYSAETPRDIPPKYIDNLNSTLNEKNYFNKLNKSKKIELISATSFILSRLLISNQYKYVEHKYGEHQTSEEIIKELKKYYSLPIEKYPEDIFSEIVGSGSTMTNTQIFGLAKNFFIKEIVLFRLVAENIVELKNEFDIPNKDKQKLINWTNNFTNSIRKHIHLYKGKTVEKEYKMELNDLLIWQKILMKYVRKFVKQLNSKLYDEKTHLELNNIYKTIHKKLIIQFDNFKNKNKRKAKHQGDISPIIKTIMNKYDNNLIERNIIVKQKVQPKKENKTTTYISKTLTYTVWLELIANNYNKPSMISLKLVQGLAKLLFKIDVGEKELKKILAL